MKGQVREKIDDKTQQVTFTNGKHRTYEYEDLINVINRPDEDGVELWDFEKSSTTNGVMIWIEKKKLMFN